MIKQFKRILSGLAGLASAVALTGSAQTATYNWTFTGVPGGHGGTPFDGSGTFTAATSISTDTGSGNDGFAGYLITGVTGTIDGQAITGIVAQNNSGEANDNLLGDGDPNNTTVTTSTASPVYFDNEVSGSAAGVAATTAVDSGYGFIFSSIPSSSDYAVIGYDNSANIIAASEGTLTITPTPPLVPEPSTLALSVVGGLGGLALCRRRK